MEENEREVSYSNELCLALYFGIMRSDLTRHSGAISDYCTLDC
jgi:hypothetical protein